MNQLTSLCLIVFLQLFSHVRCNKISAYYTIIPEMNSFGSSLECLVQIAQETSVVKYKNEDQSCEILGLSWQTNPTFDTGYIYSWITAYERPFREALNIQSPFPSNFQEYSSFEIVFRTGAVVSEWIIINILSLDKSDFLLHCNIRPDQNRTCFDSKYGGSWINDVFLPNPVTSPNTQYRLTVVYTTTAWEFYVNNAYFYSFTHRHSFDGSGYVDFYSADVYCQKIVYYSPL